MKDGKTIEILYFGADATWIKLNQVGFCRRNTYLLREFSRHPAVDRLIVVVPTTRTIALTSRTLWKQAFGLGYGEKVQDLLVFAAIPGERYWKPIKWLNEKITNWVVRRIIRDAEQTKRIHWCYWPGGLESRERLELQGTLIFDSDHDILEDDNRSAGSVAETERFLKLACQKAEIVVSSSRRMLEWFARHGARRCERLRDGVDSEWLVADAHKPVQGTEPCIGYIGVLSRWINYQLLLDLARSKPSWKFIIAGNLYRASLPDGFESLKNIKFIGRINSQQARQLLQLFDIGLALYLPGKNDGDSMKLFEYLAAGVPVVSTRLHSSVNEDYAGLLEFGDNCGQFVEAIERVLNWDEHTRDSWNQRRLSFIKRNTWTVRAHEAMEWINQIRGEGTHSIPLTTSRQTVTDMSVGEG
jgi:glycosyltransferase involved in cell wall biosynthesis